MKNCSLTFACKTTWRCLVTLSWNDLSCSPVNPLSATNQRALFYVLLIRIWKFIKLFHICFTFVSSERRNRNAFQCRPCCCREPSETSDWNVYTFVNIYDSAVHTFAQHLFTFFFSLSPTQMEIWTLFEVWHEVTGNLGGGSVLVGQNVPLSPLEWSALTQENRLVRWPPMNVNPFN